MNQKVPSGIETEAECNVSCRGRSARCNVIEGNCLGKSIVLTRTHSVDLGVGLGKVLMLAFWQYTVASA